MTDIRIPAADAVGDVEPFAHCWIAEGTSTANRARDWAERCIHLPAASMSIFRTAGLESPAEMPTLPFPHPADVVVVGVSDQADRTRARELVNLFGCSIVIVPDEHPHGWGVVAGVDRTDTAAITGAAAGSAAEDAEEPLLLVHAVATRLHPFSARPEHTDPALRIARESVQRHHPLVAVTCRLRTTDPSTALLDEARGRSLLVVGGERITSSASVLGQLIDRVAVPMLIARGGGSHRLSR